MNQPIDSNHGEKTMIKTVRIQCVSYSSRDMLHRTRKQACLVNDNGGRPAITVNSINRDSWGERAPRGVHRALHSYVYDVVSFFTPDFKRDFWRKTKVERAMDNSWRQLGPFPETSLAKFFAKRKYFISADREVSMCVFFLRLNYFATRDAEL